MGVIILTGVYAVLQSAAAGLTTFVTGSTIGGAGVAMYAYLQSLAAVVCGPVGIAAAGTGVAAGAVTLARRLFFL